MSRAQNREQRFERRGPLKFAVQVILALLAVALGCCSVAFSIAQAIWKNDSLLASRLAPFDGRITANLAASLSMPNVPAAERRRADELARKALRQDPTAVVAASMLGLNAQFRGDTAAARRLFGYAEGLSRRNLVTQLWGIEDAVGRNDIPAALRHYDIALRTSSRASEVLFPILASATSDHQIRRALTGTLTLRPLWANAFLDYLAANAPDPLSVTALFMELHK